MVTVASFTLFRNLVRICLMRRLVTGVMITTMVGYVATSSFAVILLQLNLRRRQKGRVITVSTRFRNE